MAIASAATCSCVCCPGRCGLLVSSRGEAGTTGDKRSRRCCRSQRRTAQDEVLSSGVPPSTGLRFARSARLAPKRRRGVSRAAPVKRRLYANRLSARTRSACCLTKMHTQAHARAYTRDVRLHCELASRRSEKSLAIWKPFKATYRLPKVSIKSRTRRMRIQSSTDSAKCYRPREPR